MKGRLLVQELKVRVDASSASLGQPKPNPAQKEGRNSQTLKILMRMPPGTPSGQNSQLLWGCVVALRIEVPHDFLSASCHFPLGTRGQVGYSGRGEVGEPANRSPRLSSQPVLGTVSSSSSSSCWALLALRPLRDRERPPKPSESPKSLKP